MTYTYNFFDTYWYLFHREYPAQWVKHSLTYECPNQYSVRNVKSSWIEFNLTQSFDLQWGRTVFKPSILSIKLKRSLSNLTINENITYKFIAYWTQSSILFCCTETNNIFIAVSSSEDAVFSIRTFTWSWCLRVSLCRSAVGLNVERCGLHFGSRLTCTCLQSRHLHAVERYTRIMVFWTFFPLVPPHFDDWPCHLDRCHRSESPDHRIW